MFYGKWKYKLVACIFMIMTLSVQAQRPHEGVWLSANVPVKFSSKWQWHNDGGYRTLGLNSAASQFLYRSGIRFVKNNRLNFAGGFALFYTRTSFAKTNHEFGKEFRTWQEINFQHQLAEKLQWQSRFRTEQRFFSETSSKPAYTGYRFRLRTAFIQLITEKISLQLAEEYMQQYTNGNLAFDQNRLMINGLFKCGNLTQIQAGYMWLAWPALSNQHILTLTIQKSILINGKLRG